MNCKRRPTVVADTTQNSWKVSIVILFSNDRIVFEIIYDIVLYITIRIGCIGQKTILWPLIQGQNGKEKKRKSILSNWYLIYRHYCADVYPCHVGRYFIWEKIVVAQNGWIEEKQEKKQTNYTEKLLT